MQEDWTPSQKVMSFTEMRCRGKEEYLLDRLQATGHLHLKELSGLERELGVLTAGMVPEQDRPGCDHPGVHR